ncbi:MAG: deoxyguanosinetriphosphate triphosphohydrolase [Xylanivirga thermophila]|jgi:dGTPase|uniref:deoxyguanosinetriphosphate triphosphohydrolase n=1 Tax=Xylanivirga thermophila TaxID=2496273 RepID=UPI00101CFAB0|nr:deoxyguanosinetriphosphate triphosphohydrolase [Xylanivirga thermophila]
MDIRQHTELLEKQILSPYAALSSNSKGRQYPQEKCIIRTEFQRDRDRIIHCKSFRRLKHKTQVFIAPEGDHYRTRLTHTLEVAQIARTVSRALRLNEDLTEAIALGHDLGHTPFGHIGEKVLNGITDFGFKHNVHSLRVVEVLENGKGLNLTWETRDGILNHTKSSRPSTLEGQVVNLSDRIAYINHDIDDAIRAKLISTDDLPKDCIDILGTTHAQRINSMVTDVIVNSTGQANICMSNKIDIATEKLRKFMFEEVYLNEWARNEEKKAAYVIEELYSYFLKYADKLPSEYYCNIDFYGVQQVVCDYIAGMSDRYALNLFYETFMPHAWNIY